MGRTVKKLVFALCLFLGLIVAWATILVVFAGNGPIVNLAGFVGIIIMLPVLVLPSSGRKGLKDYAGCLARWKISIRWYLLAILVPLAVELLALAVFYLIDGKYLPLGIDYWNWSYVAGLTPKLFYVTVATMSFAGYVLFRTPEKYPGIARGLAFCISLFAALALLIAVAVLQDSNNLWLFVSLIPVAFIAQWIYEKAGKSLLPAWLFFFSFLALELASPVNWLLTGGFPEAMMYGAVFYFLIAIFLIFAESRFFFSKAIGPAPGKVRSGLPVAVLAVAVIVAVVSLAFIISVNANMSYPEPSGPYTVGRIAYDWTDPGRKEIATGNATDRELMVYVWYPAGEIGDRQEASLMDAKTATALRPGGLFTLGFLGGLSEHAYLDVPLSAGASQYPVLIMSHGDTSSPLLMAVTAADLASHGYIVAGISHTYNAQGTAFPDGRIVSRDDNYTLFGDEHFDTGLSYYENAKQWARHNAEVEQREAADVSFVIDRLIQLNLTDGLFRGKVDVSRIGTFGHSLGGATAITSAENDGRIKAAADLDGALYHAPNNTKPTLLLERGSRIGYNRTYDVVNRRLLTPEQFMEMKSIWDDSEYAILEGPTAYYVGINGTEHNNFKDYGPLGVPLDTGKIDGRYATTIIDAYLLAFFNKHLNGTGSPLLDGAHAYPEVVFKRHADGIPVVP